MKKKLLCLLVLVFILGIASVSFASPVSQFSDVPAKSWEYNAITTLARAGIVDGYGDGTFRGDKTMTRYEMAQIVANAMTKVDKVDAANKAIIYKLATEFSAELQSLGERVTTVEKNQGNVTLSGDARVRWVRWDNATASPYTKGLVQNNYDFIATDRVNDDVTGTLRMYLMRNNQWGLPSQSVASPNTNETNEVMEAKFEVRNFLGQNNTTLTAGRFAQTFGATTYIANLYGVDGVKVDFGNKLKVELGFADFSNPLSNFTKLDTDQNMVTTAGSLYFKNAAFAKLAYDTSKATQIQAFYLKNTNGAQVANIYDIGVTTTVAPNLVLKGDYLKNTQFDTFNTNKQIFLMYGGANVAKPGTWGVGVGYADADARANFGWGDYDPITMWPVADLKVWNAKVEYALMKNVSFRFCQSFDAKTAETGAKAPNGEWTRAEFNFFF
jgi:hypothetical protein